MARSAQHDPLNINDFYFERHDLTGVELCSTGRHPLHQPAGLQVMAEATYRQWLDAVTAAAAWGEVGCAESEARAVFAARFGAGR
jgi:hypothetical protein